MSEESGEAAPPQSSDEPAVVASCGAPIVFASRRHNATGSESEDYDSLYLMNEDGTAVVRLSDVLEGAPPRNVLGKWSTDAQQIVFNARAREGAEGSEIFLADFESGTVRPVTDDDYIDSIPILSPDGSRIAYSSTREENTDVYVVALDGSEPERVTESPGTDNFPGWSPDGTKLVFQSDRDGDFEIYIVDLETGVETQVTDNEAGDLFPHWSYDGERIVFNSNLAWSEPYQDDLYIVDVDGTNLTRVTDDPSREADASWSPDNQRLLFHSSRDGDQELYIVNVDSTGLVQLTFNDVRDAHAHWAPVELCVDDLLEAAGKAEGNA